MECRTVRKIWLAAALVLALVLGCGLAQADVVVEVDTHAELLQAIADAKAAGEQAIADGKEAPLYVIRLTTETLVLDQLIVEPLGGTLNYYHFLVLEYPARVSIESACQSGTTITVDWDEYSSLIAAGKGFGAPILINGSYYQENGSYYTTVDPLLRLRNLTFDFSGSSKMKSHELMINGMGGTLDFENVTFRNLERNGGYDRQLLIVSGMEIKMSNCIFEDNALLSRTGKSTAFAASASNVRVENCTFRDNTGNYGAAVQIDGAGFLGHKNPEALFINCAFTGNTSWSSPAFRSEYAEVTLQRCTFTGNKAVSDEDLHREGGGAIAIAHSTVALQDCTFEDNMTDFSGGAIQIMYKSDVTVDGCTITGNSADTHGGAFCLTDYFRDDPSEGSVLKIVNTTISSNVSTGKHGDITHRGDNYSPGGGAIYMHPNCKLILGEGTILADNTVEAYDKTADSYHGGAIYAAYGSEIVIDGAVITGNKARHGGAVYLEGAGTLEGIQGEHDPGAFPKSKGNGAVMTLKNGLIAENHAALNGGAVYVGGQTMVDGAEYQGAVFTMTGGVVTDNQADDMGGGVYVQGAQSGDSAGVLKMTGGAIYYNVAGENGNTSSGASDAGAEIYEEGGNTAISVVSALDITDYIQNPAHTFVPEEDQTVWFSNWYDDYSDQDPDYGKADGKAGTGTNTGRYMSSLDIDRMKYYPVAGDSAYNALILGRETSLLLHRAPTGIEEMKNTQFLFEIMLKDLPETPGVDTVYPVRLQGTVLSNQLTTLPGGGKGIDLSSGKVTLSMRPGDLLEIQALPAGTEFKIVETERLGFDAVSIESDNVLSPNVVIKQYVITGSTVTTWNGGQTRSDVIYDNFTEYPVPETGDGSHAGPYLLLLITSAAALILLKKKAVRA